MSTPSPPAAKRPKLDAEAPATLSSPAREPATATTFASAPPTGNGATNETRNGINDEDESSDEEEEVQPEKEDLSHRDMYLDTVSLPLPVALTPGRQVQTRL